MKSVKGLEDSAVHAKYIELVRRVGGDIQCSLLMGSYTVCRDETCRARAPEREAEVDKGQGCRYVVALCGVYSMLMTYAIYSEEPAIQGEPG